MRKEKLEELKSYIEEFKTIEKTKIEGNHFIKSECYQIKLNNGEIIKREKLLKGNLDGSAVIVLPITINNTVILIVEPRVFSKRTIGVGVPSGYIEENETDYDAAKRELKEETGLTTDKLIKLGSFYQDIGCSSAYNSIFIALDVKKEFEQNLDKDEYVKYIEVTFDEALELINMGYIEDVSSLLLFERAKTYMKERKYEI